MLKTIVTVTAAITAGKMGGDKLYNAIDGAVGLSAKLGAQGSDVARTAATVACGVAAVVAVGMVWK